MFRGFAFQTHGGGDWEGWTPPWEQGRHFGPGAAFRAHMRQGHRGPFGHGHHRGPFGPRGPFGQEGPFGEGRRFFGRGDVKYALLELLQERPMHGYEMMKSLEERSGGFYVPSAGTIYPTLQMLEDRGLVTSNEAGGKRVYSITDAGKTILADRQKEEEAFHGPWERFGPQARRWNSPEVQALRSEAMEVARLFAIAGKTAFNDPEQINRLRGIISQARQDLTDMIYGPKGTSEPGVPPTPEHPQ